MTDFILTKEQLRQALPKNPYIDQWYDVMSRALPDYDINTPKRVSAFLAQCMHESGGFGFLTVNLHYQAATLSKVWPSKFPPDVAGQYAHNQEKIANRAYAGRMGNGPEESGDGWRYAGKGLIQLTGKDNYTRFAESIETPVEQLPEYLGTFEGAVQSACWFWETNGLNQFADSGDILTLTKCINGGTLGLEERTQHYQHAIQVFGR